MKPLRCAVIGVGYLGKFHAQKYAKIQGCELVAVVDSREDVARAVAEPLGCRALTDPRELLGHVDAVSIAVPTQAHHAVCLDFLRAGVHVLVEKPMTTTLAQADELIALADAQKRVLAVGHLERFNPAALALDPLLSDPRFIDSSRLAPLKPRATDVSVLLDLMIHDVDLILSLVDSEVESVDCSGARVLTQGIDQQACGLAAASGGRGGLQQADRPGRRCTRARSDDAALGTAPMAWNAFCVAMLNDVDTKSGQLESLAATSPWSQFT